MLSYRHAYHAGNFADVLKHIVLLEILDHLSKKDAPFDYIDTHAGAGRYDLGSEQAQKLGEHLQGVLKLRPENFPELARYFEVLHAFNTGAELQTYPGSPCIVQHCLRPQDRMWLYELHPQDFQRLQSNLKKNKNLRIHCEDGLKALLALLPPASRRAVVLIDPSYELKNEYDLVFQAVAKAYKKFATGTYAIWYPVVDRRKIERLERQFAESGIRDIQRFELGVAADANGPGMTASGMLVINPPWTLFEKMSKLLPRLAAALGRDTTPVFKCDVLAAE